MNDINWQYFPKSDEIPLHLKDIVSVFEQMSNEITSSKFDHSSDVVLSHIKDSLILINYKVEHSKREKIRFLYYLAEMGN